MGSRHPVASPILSFIQNPRPPGPAATGRARRFPVAKAGSARLLPPMIPTRLAAKTLCRPFRHPLVTAAGTSATRECRLLRVEFDTGAVGYAELAARPGLPAPEAPEAALRAARLWVERGRGALAYAAPCAALLRTDDDAPGFRDAGYTVVKRKIAVAPLRDEQRAVAGLVRTLGPTVRLRLDANGGLSERDAGLWCDFLGEFPEVEWLEQPLPAGAEDAMRRLGERAGVAERLALDESLDGAAAFPEAWPGILAVKPALLDHPERLGALPADRLAYASAFESPFGRQTALALAAEHPSPFALGFGTLGAFADALDRHAPGPVAATLAWSPAEWDELWNTI